MKCNFRISGNNQKNQKLCGKKAIFIKRNGSSGNKLKVRCLCKFHHDLVKANDRKRFQISRKNKLEQSYSNSFDYFLSQINSVTNPVINKLIKDFCSQKIDSQIWENRLKKVIGDICWELDIKVYQEYVYFIKGGIQSMDLFIPNQKKIKRPILIECKSGYRRTGAQERKPEQVHNMTEGIKFNKEFKNAIVKTFTTDDKDGDGFIHELIKLRVIK